jgi:hypothetical protein
VGLAWAGHPVNFALLTARGHQFIAYYDEQRRIVVEGRRLGETAWTIVRPGGVPVPGENRQSNVTGWDSHNSLDLALDQSGRLHLAGNMHAKPLIYYRTREPWDVASLERLDRMTGAREGSCTYPVFFDDFQGELMFRYRDGRSGNGSDIYNRYNDAAHTWSRALDTPLQDGQGHRNAYALDPVLGPDHRFHVVWMWRDSPDCSTNNTLSYVRSADFIHWEDSRGQPVTLPMTLASGEVIDPAKPHGGLINMTFNLGFDAQQRPVVVYHRYDAAGHSQVYAARPNAAGGWAVVQLSQWSFTWAFSGNGSIAAEVRLGAPQLQADGTLLLGYETKAEGDGRWRLDGKNLRVIESLPADPPLVPLELLRPVRPGLEVQTVTARNDGVLWILRWETQPRNRDQPYPSAPTPSVLQLYHLPSPDPGSARQ